jgi:hypothetical protein
VHRRVARPSLDHRAGAQPAPVKILDIDAERQRFSLAMA